MTNTQQQYWRDSDLCERYRVSKTTIWRWRSKGILPEGKVMGGTRLTGEKELAEIEESK